MASTTTTTTHIRPAASSEDVLCSRILTNAFLPIWNHNWFQNISAPLDPVPLHPTQSSPPLCPLQTARTRFYLSLIKSTRLLRGEILVNVVDGEADESARIGAILLWLPPHARMSISTPSILYRSGFLRTLYDYGLVGTHRIANIFESNIGAMFKAAGVIEVEHHFVEMLAVNPVFMGRGLGSNLLRWRVERVEGGEVVMDTSTEQARGVYEEMGFRVLGERAVRSGCNELGVRVEGEGVEQKQWVLMLRGGEYIPARGR